MSGFFIPDCPNHKIWLLSTNVRLIWRSLQDILLELPENCCNLNEILAL